MSGSLADTSAAVVAAPAGATYATQQQAQSQQQQVQPVRKGTKQESFESRGKKGTSGPNATSRALIYNTPLPLCLPSSDSSLSLLYSLTWTISLSCQIILAQFRARDKSRNKVPKEAYLNDKIQAYWDERTKSVWVLPTRKTKRRRRTKRDGDDDGSEGSGTVDGASTSSSTSSMLRAEASQQMAATEDEAVADEKEEEQTPWMDVLWKRGFFGKGSLSRSEPTWWQREKNRVTGEHGECVRMGHLVTAYPVEKPALQALTVVLCISNLTQFPRLKI